MTEISHRQRVTRPLRMRGGVAKRNSANHEPTTFFAGFRSALRNVDSCGWAGPFIELMRNTMKANWRMFGTALVVTVFAMAASAQELGRVHFRTSCNAQAQEKFDRGLAMVHSFVYPDSVKAFTEAAA